MKKLMIGFAVGAAMASCAFATSIELEGTYWMMTLDGTAAVGFEGVEGTTVDLQDDLGYDEGENIPGATIIAGDTHQFGVNFFALDLSAENQVDKVIQFSDVVFPVSAVVASELDATFIRAFYRLNAQAPGVRGGIILGGQYVDLSAEASSDAFGSASEQVEAGMPILGAFLHLFLPFLSARGSVVGSTYDFGDVEADFIDFEAGVQVDIPPGIYAGAGYRYVQIDGTDSENLVDVDVTLSGPMIYAGFTW